jgi:AAA family ATP:ADP antiporter
MSNESSGPVSRILKATTKIETHELRATILSFLFVFALMTAYFIIRPVRDAMASDWSRAETSWLWTATFFFSVIGVAVYGFIISRVNFSKVVPGVYVFFAATFGAFYLGSGIAPDPTLVDKAFYVWLSVFSLFHVSVFWSFMSGLFSREQAPRLFAVIASGASVGAMVGPSIPGFFAEGIGVMNLMLISAAILLVPLPIIRALEKLKVTELGNANLEADLSQAKRLGKNPFSGFTLFVSNPYLLAIGIFILMYVTMSTFVYMEMREMLAVYERPERAQILGRIDLAVNTLAIITAMFATSRLTTRFGMATTLSLIPVLMVGGWLVVAIVPLLGVLIGLQIARRAGNYAVTKPGREMLFTLVDNETRYKAKPVIDIVVYRGGDMVTAWFHTVLRESFAFGLGGVAIVAAVVAALWAASGAYLGRTYNRSIAASKDAVRDA